MVLSNFSQVFESSNSTSLISRERGLCQSMSAKPLKCSISVPGPAECISTDYSAYSEKYTIGHSLHGVLLWINVIRITEK